MFSLRVFGVEYLRQLVRGAIAEPVAQIVVVTRRRDVPRTVLIREADLERMAASDVRHRRAVVECVLDRIWKLSVRVDHDLAAIGQVSEALIDDADLVEVVLRVVPVLGMKQEPGFDEQAIRHRRAPGDRRDVRIRVLNAARGLRRQQRRQVAKAQAAILVVVEDRDLVLG